jgi:hypothetical protein
MTITDLCIINPYGLMETLLIEKKASNEITFKVKLFSANFNIIMSLLQFDSSSNPNSLVYFFNTNLDFGSEFSKVNRLQEFYDQLILIDNQIDDLYLLEYNAIKQICESTIQNDNDLFIKIDD